VEISAPSYYQLFFKVWRCDYYRKLVNRSGSYGQFVLILEIAKTKIS